MLMRYRRRCKVERLFARLSNFLRKVIRFERRVDNYLGFVQLGCIIVPLVYLLDGISTLSP